MKYLSFMILTSLLIFSIFLNADTIIISADPWMPYNGDPQALQPGYCIDIAVKVFAKKGHEIKYISMPYSRAILEARKGAIQGIIGCTKQEVPTFIFPNEAIGVSTNYFYARQDFKWQYQGLKSLKNLKVGVIQNYSYGDKSFDDYIAESRKKNNNKVQILVGESALERLINLTIMNRLDLFVEDQFVMNYTLIKLRKSHKIKEIARLSQYSNIYIAFSPACSKSKEYARILSDGIIELRQNGELKSILEKYGLKDWK